MARRVILDTGVLIAIERGRLDVDTVLGLDDAAIAAITAMELLAGVERADTAYRQARAVRVEAILSSLLARWARRNCGTRISFRLFREILLRLDKPSSNSSFSALLRRFK
jgi:predicted nucleic acid-binding protein